MIRVGEMNSLKIRKETPHGLFLGNDEESVLLPRVSLSDKLKIGDEIDVFVYTDSQDRPIATQAKPFGFVGDFVPLRVVDISSHGAFFDWGLSKDLLVPRKELHRRFSVGDTAVVSIQLDNNGRCVGATKLASSFDYDVSSLRPGQEVDLLVYDFNSLGALVVVEGRHTGLLYKNELFKKVAVGDRLVGYVKSVREDNKVDVSLQKRGVDAIDVDKKRLLDALEAANGALEIHDKSPAEEVVAKLQMSKKAFKRALGGLYKSGVVELVDGGIRLKK